MAGPPRPDRRRPVRAPLGSRRPRTVGSPYRRVVVRDGSGDRTGPGLRRTAGYAWRLLAVGAAAYAAYVVLGRLELPVVALFLALVITSVLRPLTDLLARRMPRALAVLFTLLGAALVLVGLGFAVGSAVAAESDRLGTEIHGGVDRIEHWLAGSPFHLKAGSVSDLQHRISSFVAEHRGQLIDTALNSAGRLVEAGTVLALALFCSAFFLHSGERMWGWAQQQLGPRAGSTWGRVGRTGWRTFAGYTRGLFLIAGTNAILVGIGLLVLRVPLALPLMLLEFFAAFVPLIGSPVALAVAALVALATRGPVVALLVLALIVVIGQIEGHLLHPLVMSWAVRIHPVAVALSVAAGAVLGGVIGAALAVPAVSVAWAVRQELRAPPDHRRSGR
ncbi:AI-2E family transporter [Kitasatospora terrestris]|uniref:AI-2E family transporter n=1 Tax=Kitasatospora terrestris TaxID=258051 RepID=A0ABP9EQK5_9ACTN